MLILLSLFILLRLLIKKVIEQNVLFWPYLLFISSLAIIQNYFFPLVVFIQSGFILLFLLLFTRISLSHVSGWIKYFILYLFLYYIIGPGAALIYTAGALVILILKSSDKVYIKCAVIIISSALIPYFAYAVLFNVTLFDAYLSFFPNLSILVKYDTSRWFYANPEQ